MTTLRKFHHPCSQSRLPEYFSSRFLLIFSLLSIIFPQGIANATKCHRCLFALALCTNPLDCYNQPDTCSNTNFSPLLTQIVDCEFGCEQYVTTDATGALVMWRRDCATKGVPRNSYICSSRNIFFMRHEQCWCHSDYCNSSLQLKTNIILIAATSLYLMVTLMR